MMSPESKYFFLVLAVVLATAVAGCNSSTPHDSRFAVTSANFDRIIKNATNTVILDFWAPWCGPCREMNPVFTTIADENPGIVFGKINVDEEPALAEKNGVQGIPTFIAISNGTTVGSITGAVDKKTFQAFVDEHSRRKQ